MGQRSHHHDFGQIREPMLADKPLSKKVLRIDVRCWDWYLPAPFNGLKRSFRHPKERLRTIFLF